MTHRKTLAVILTVAMLLLAGCGTPADGSSNPVQDDSDATQPTNQTNQTNQSNTSNGTTQPIEESNQSNATSSGGTDASETSDGDTHQQKGDSSMTDDQSEESKQQQTQNTQETETQQTETTQETKDTQKTENAQETEQRSDSNSNTESDSSDSNDGSKSSNGDTESTSDSENDNNSNNSNNQENQSNETESGGTVTLTLEDQDGDPITRGTVRITLPGAENNFGPRELQPNENGKVSFEAPVDENYYYGVTGQGINYDNNNGQINVNGDTQETIQVIEITNTLTVQADSAVTIERASDGATTTREPTSGAAGFTVLPGEYTISAEGYESQTVDVQDDTNVALESTQPERSEVVISTTTAASGTGLESTVTLTGPDGETHSKETGMDGEVAFTVPPGEYEYELTPTRDRTYALGMFGYSNTISVGEEASTTHEFTFFEEPDPKDVEMEVVNAETGEPIEGATIEGMSPSMSNPYKPAFSVETNQNGIYQGTIPSAPSVQYDYSVSAEGYATIGGSENPQNLAGHTFELQPTESNQQTSSQESTSEESDTESSEETSSQDNSSEKSSNQPTKQIESGNQTNSSEPAEA